MIPFTQNAQEINPWRADGCWGLRVGRGSDYNWHREVFGVMEMFYNWIE